MSTLKTTALLAGMAMTLTAPTSSAQHIEAIGSSSGLEPGSPYIIYLGDSDGTPQEVIHAGDIPYVGERRLLLPSLPTSGGSGLPYPGSEMNDRELAMFLAIQDRIFNISQGHQTATASVPTPSAGLEPGQTEKKGQWTVGRLRPFIQADAGNAGGATLGGGQENPVEDEQPADMAGKPQHEVGRLRQTMNGQSPVSPSMGQADGVLADGDQGLGMASGGTTLESQWGGFESDGSGSLGGETTVGNGLQGHGMNGDVGAGSGGHGNHGEDAPRHNDKDTVGSRDAVDLFDLGNVAGTSGVSTGNVTIVLSAQGLGLLMDM